jgi:hypothetical protein
VPIERHHQAVSADHNLNLVIRDNVGQHKGLASK